MKWVAILVLAACGRIGFDAPGVIDGAIDDGNVDGASPDADAAATPFTYVQGASVTQSSAAQLDVTFPAAQIVGSTNVVVIGVQNVSLAIASVTDDAGHVYARAIGPTESGGLTQWTYVARVINAPSTNTVHVAFVAPASLPGVFVAEYGGVSATSAVHTTSGATGTTMNSASGPVTVSIAPALIVAANTNGNPGTVGPGTGYTQRLRNAFDDILQDTVVTVPGVYTAEAPLTTMHDWAMQAVVLAPM